MVTSRRRRRPVDRWCCFSFPTRRSHGGPPSWFKREFCVRYEHSYHVKTRPQGHGALKSESPPAGALLFRADGIRICNRRGRLHLVKSFIVSEGRTIQRIDEVLFDELYRFYRRASCRWSRTPRWRSSSPTAPASWRPGASLSAAPARNWPPLWMQRLNSLTKTHQISYK